MDAVINHMLGAGHVYGLNGATSSGSSYFSVGSPSQCRPHKTLKGVSGAELFPLAGFTRSMDFHDRYCPGCDPTCGIPISAYPGSTGNAWRIISSFLKFCLSNRTPSSRRSERNPKGLIIAEVRMCRLYGLLDLDHSSAHVQSVMGGYLNDLIDIGVAGFRVADTAHMWPADLAQIYASLHNLRSDVASRERDWVGDESEVFGANLRPLVVGAVTDLDGLGSITSSEYTQCCGRVTNFK